MQCLENPCDNPDNNGGTCHNHKPASGEEDGSGSCGGAESGEKHREEVIDI